MTHNQHSSRFELVSEGQLAKLDYVRVRGVLNLVHTEVPAPLEGQGIGSALVRAALEHAREEGLRVKASCSFAAGYLKRHPEYADLVSRRQQ